MPVNIHGKQYKTVAERLNELNSDEVKYSLVTEIISWEKEVIVMKATLKFGNQKFTGHSYEKENATRINENSALEVCETSCIGRALASAGYGGEEFASADEMVNALAQQDSSSETKTSQPKQNVTGAKFSIDAWSEESRKKEIPFGKYKKDGLSWGAVPLDYLIWVEEKSTMGDDAKEFARLEKEYRLKSKLPKKEQKQAKEVKDFAEKVIKKIETNSVNLEKKPEKLEMTMEDIAKKVAEEEELPF